MIYIAVHMCCLDGRKLTGWDGQSSDDEPQIRCYKLRYLMNSEQKSRVVEYFVAMVLHVTSIFHTWLELESG